MRVTAASANQRALLINKAQSSVPNEFSASSDSPLLSPSARARAATGLITGEGGASQQRARRRDGQRFVVGGAGGVCSGQRAGGHQSGFSDAPAAWHHGSMRMNLFVLSRNTILWLIGAMLTFWVAMLVASVWFGACEKARQQRGCSDAARCEQCRPFTKSLRRRRSRRPSCLAGACRTSGRSTT